MPLPTITKTWEFDVNHVQITTNAELLFQIKNKLIGSGATSFSNPPTVKSSSDASSAGNSDLWLNAGDITFDDPGTAHSWIVFELDAIQPGLEMCFDCVDNPGGGHDYWQIYFSDADGFTGGTSTNRPTATDEMNSFGGGSHAVIDGAATLATNPARLHMAQSSDGQHLRFWAYSANVMIGYFEIGRVRNPATLWAQPWAANNSWYKYNSGAQQAQCTYAKLLQNAGSGGSTYLTQSYAGGQKTGLLFLQEARGPAGEEYLGFIEDHQQELEPDGSFSAFGIGLYSDTIGSRGKLGDMIDVWMGLQFMLTGDHFDGVGKLDFVLLDDMIVPWAGAAAGLMKRI